MELNEIWGQSNNLCFGASFQVKNSDENILPEIIHLQMLFGICNLLVEKVIVETKLLDKRYSHWIILWNAKDAKLSEVRKESWKETEIHVNFLRNTCITKKKKKPWWMWSHSKPC